MRWLEEKILQGTRTAMSNPYIILALMAALLIVVLLAPEDRQER